MAPVPAPRSTTALAPSGKQPSDRFEGRPRTEPLVARCHVAEALPRPAASDRPQNAISFSRRWPRTLIVSTSRDVDGDASGCSSHTLRCKGGGAMEDEATDRVQRVRARLYCKSTSTPREVLARATRLPDHSSRLPSARPRSPATTSRPGPSTRPRLAARVSQMISRWDSSSWRESCHIPGP